MGGDGSVGIAIRYGLDGPGIEYRRWWIFYTYIQNDPRTHPPYCMRGTGPFPVVKRSRRGVDQPISSSTEVEERVELYLYSLSVSTWQGYSVNFTFY